MLLSGSRKRARDLSSQCNQAAALVQPKMDARNGAFRGADHIGGESQGQPKPLRWRLVAQQPQLHLHLLGVHPQSPISSLSSMYKGT
jgi:hypothetical protein